ncbi:MAG TPA: hypothetical protein VG939_03100 [Caulobacteraceae bacterium]|nr:hypothetical protein [Caulobacteraceae bacterium]
MTTRIALAATLAVLSAVSAPIAQGAPQAAPWIDASAPRAPPPLPWQTMAHCHARDDECHRAAWKTFLKERGLTELSAPAGGKAYRWFWYFPGGVGPTGAPHNEGFVQIVLDHDGSGTLRSAWSDKTFPVGAADVAAFEEALARSEFPAMSPDPAISCLDDCEDQWLEVVADGRYRMVESEGGVPPRLHAAAKVLERLAAQRAGLDAELRP